MGIGENVGEHVGENTGSSGLSLSSQGGPGTLKFSSGMNNVLTITPYYISDGLYATQSGTDSITGYDWVTTPESLSTISDATRWNLGYNQLGSSVHTDGFGVTKIVEVTQDPDNAGNQVLHQQHGADTANAATDGRMQGFWACTTSPPYFKSAYWKYKMYLENYDYWPNNSVSGYFDWNCIWEIFQKEIIALPDFDGYATTYCNVIYSGQYGLGDVPPYTLGWRLLNRYDQRHNGGGGWATNWSYDSTVTVPTNSWFTLEVFYNHGIADGRVWVRMTPAGGTKTILFNISQDVAHWYGGELVSDLQMFKHYGGAETYRAAANAGYPMGIYYDNFEYWECTESEFDAWIAAGG